MDNSLFEQERLCLDVKYLSNLLRTKLSLIEDFKEFKHYSIELKNLNDVVSDIYWNL